LSRHFTCTQILETINGCLYAISMLLMPCDLILLKRSNPSVIRNCCTSWLLMASLLIYSIIWLISYIIVLSELSMRILLPRTNTWENNLTSFIQQITRLMICSSYFVVAICYVQNCELSYNVLGMTENCNHTECWKWTFRASPSTNC